NVLFQRNRDFPLGTKRFPNADERLTFPRASRDAAQAPPDDALLLVPGVAVDHVEAYSGIAVPRAGTTLPTLAIHPRTAARLGLADTDTAVVSNARGELNGIVKLTDTVAP